MRFLLWLEQTAPSIWIRESPSLWGFPFILLLHTVGLGVAAGFGVALNVWWLRESPGESSVPLQAGFTVAGIGFALALASGLLLLLAYPTKALTDGVFYVKIALIVAALGQLGWLRPRFAGGSSSGRRAFAVAAIVAWLGAIVAGRFLAYTYNYLTAVGWQLGY